MKRGVLAAAVMILVFSAAHAEPIYWEPGGDRIESRNSVLPAGDPEISVIIDGPLKPFNPDLDASNTDGNGAAFPGLGDSGPVNVGTVNGGAQPVPESGTLLLLSVGLVSVLGARRRIFK
jgi:hypothetical protein